MPDSQAERARRSRAHRTGDHSLCTGRCAVVRASAGGSNGVPDQAGPIGLAVEAYVGSLYLGDSDARNVMAQCCRKLAEAFDSAAGRDMPSVSKELRTSLSWLSEAGDAEDQLAEIRSRRLLRRTTSILADVDRQRSRIGDDGA